MTRLSFFKYQKYFPTVQDCNAGGVGGGDISPDGDSNLDNVKVDHIQENRQ